MGKQAWPLGRKSVLFLGIVLAFLGVVLLVSPAAVGGAVVRLVALIMILTGFMQFVQIFRAHRMGERLVSGILGAIVAGVGVLVWLNPDIGSGVLTALLMIFFVIHGFWKIATALRFRGVGGWVWLLFSGALSLFFVYLLWSQWPLSGAWAIGVLVGLDLLLTGLALILVSVGLKRFRSPGYADTISL
jgi:uncharacterized membrane protein HdeD (DUF308 family)